jgi:hypothetical protein
MSRGIINEINRIKKIMSLIVENDETVKVLASSDGLVNIIDTVDKIVYRYKLMANVGKKQEMIFVRSIDIVTGVITYLEPNKNVEMTKTIDSNTITKILSDYKNKTSFFEIFKAKKYGFDITVDLIFFEQQNIKIK